MRQRHSVATSTHVRADAGVACIFADAFLAIGTWQVQVQIKEQV